MGKWEQKKKKIGCLWWEQSEWTVCSLRDYVDAITCFDFFILRMEASYFRLFHSASSGINCYTACCSGFRLRTDWRNKEHHSMNRKYRQPQNQTAPCKISTTSRFIQIQTQKIKESKKINQKKKNSKNTLGAAGRAPQSSPPSYPHHHHRLAHPRRLVVFHTPPQELKKKENQKIKNTLFCQVDFPSPCPLQLGQSIHGAGVRLLSFLGPPT